ncbi:MAG: L,D-transpeptidase family protein [Myxococcaceae bacterium]
MTTLVAASRWNETLLSLWAEERRACADFLSALAEFDKNEAWRPLGYSGLFRYLTRALGMSEGLAYSRLSAVRLSHWCPAVFPALSAGKLCLTTLGEVAKVVTPENWEAVLPRFFGKSKREAQALAATLLPGKAPMRDVVVALPCASTAAPALHPVREVGEAAASGEVQPVLHPEEAALRHKGLSRRPERAPTERATEIRVDKSERRMTLLRDGRVFRTYRIRLGDSPEGHKLQRGDEKTPEGDYVISGRNPKIDAGILLCDFGPRIHERANRHHASRRHAEKRRARNIGR